MKPIEVDEHLEMRLVEEDRSEELAVVVRENLEYLYEWMPWVSEDFSAETAMKFIKRSLNEYKNDESKNFLILRNDKVIGSIGAKNIDLVNRSAEIGYWVAENEQGGGVVTKCCRRLIKFLFDEINLNRIVIRCATENVKSQAIPERLGFTKEGISRQVEWLHDRFVGLVVYSLLKEEWENIEH